MRHLERALQIAATSTERQRHGCILAKGNRVLAVGVNANRNQPLNCTDPSREAGIHAEAAAIRAVPVDTDWSRVTLYSARLRRNGTPGLAAPCPNCAELIDRLGIKEVLWTT